MKLTEQLIEKVDRYGAHNYKPLDVVLREGKGAKVRDVDGKGYLDFLSSYSALNFGHQHPKLVSTLKQQAERLAVCSRAFHSEELCLFSEELAKFCGMESVLPMNSGAEAIETAIKVARKWGYQKKGVASDRAKIVAMRNNFHGRTISIVSFSTEEAYRDGFGPFTPGFELVPFGDADAAERVIDASTVAVIVEPIQAEAGILIPPAGYLTRLREICTRKKALLIFDEIQTGLGRTGIDFCFQHENAKPDVLVLGKSLGGGLLPISAVVANREVMDVIRPGEHGSTFGGNPLACALARASIKLLREEMLSHRASELGRVAMGELGWKPLKNVKEVRGKGLLIGIELEESTGGARKYCERLAQEGVLCKETHTYVIRIAPPLTIEEEDLMAGIGKIIQVIQST